MKILESYAVTCAHRARMIVNPFSLGPCAALRSTLALAGVVALAVGFAIVVRVAQAGQNRCCDRVDSYPDCSGCVEIGTNRYVKAGDNSANKCQAGASSQFCDESLISCFYLQNTNVYSDGNCTNVIEVVTVARSVPQCNAADDGCYSGG